MSSTEGHVARRGLSRVGRALRFLAGVDENVMDQVPQERAWYAAMGGAVLGTAAFAAVSMWFAVEEMLGAAYLGALLPAALWFLIILNLDRWIVTSRPGHGWQRFGLLATRATLAILIGVVIAEPLVMRVFENKIEESVRHDRAEFLANRQGRLITCNQDLSDPKATPPTGCIDKDLFDLTTAKADANELATVHTDADKVQQSIDGDSETLRKINDKARAECVGDKEAGTTGIPGEGPECLLLRKEAQRFEAAHPLADRMARVATMRAHIADLEANVNSSRQNFEQARQTAIRDELSKETQVDDPIGILERMEALSAIAKANGTLAVGIIFVRLLFITVDLTPVLMKTTVGKTSYEQIITDQLREVVDAKRMALKEKRQDHERERQRDIEQGEATDRAEFFQSVDRLAEAYESGGQSPHSPSDTTGERIG